MDSLSRSSSSSAWSSGGGDFFNLKIFKIPEFRIYISKYKGNITKSV
jgi:hypothetical protein